MLLCSLFEWKQICASFYRLFISAFWLEIQLLREGDGLTFTSVIPPYFICLSQARTLISNIICHVHFCVQLVQLR